MGAARKRTTTRDQSDASLDPGSALQRGLGIPCKGVSAHLCRPAGHVQNHTMRRCWQKLRSRPHAAPHRRRAGALETDSKARLGKGKNCRVYVSLPRLALQEIEAHARAQGLGIWSQETEQSTVIVNTLKDNVEFLENYRNVELAAFIDQIYDGSSYKVVFGIDGIFQQINFCLSGLKCPVYRKNLPNIPVLVEAFSEEARYFVQKRLLQKNVVIILECVVQGCYYGSIKHSAGNIGDLLLSSGLATVTDWNLSTSTSGANYKHSESAAKNSRLRIWKGPMKLISASQSFFNARVIRIIGPDTLLIEMENLSERRIQLSSIRPPKRAKNDQDIEIGYYPIATEFLRSRLIGEIVSVKIDYSKDSDGDFPLRECATVMKGDQNMAESLVSRGLAYVFKHQRDDMSR